MHSKFKAVAQVLTVSYSVLQEQTFHSLASQPSFRFTVDESLGSSKHACLATFAEPVADVEQWRPLLLQAEQLLSSRTIWEPPAESPFY
eukprot:6252111-Amphidinium_carterae.1